VIELVIDQRRRDLGGGFEVGRVLPFAKRRMVGPFVFFDHMGPMTIAAGADRSIDVRPHPHIGLSTVSYLFSGEIMHRDSLGFEQSIQPTEVNWMTAGRGITHSERFEKARREGDTLHGIQAWVALPDGMEEIAPAFANHSGDDLPTWSEPGIGGRLIAGSSKGLSAATQTHSPIFYIHLDLKAGAVAEVPDDYSERAIYVASGAVEVDGSRHEAGRMLVVDAHTSKLAALEDATVMILGGEPLGERFIYWNFVSSSKERLAQAAEDWRQNRMKLPDADSAEFMPLPDDPAPPAPAMS